MRLAALALLCLSATSAPTTLAATTVAKAGDEVDIGDLGTTIEVGTRWTRTTVEPTLGDYQFLGRSSLNGAFFFVVEHLGVYEDEADFQENIQLLSAMQQSGGDVEGLAGESFERTNGLGHLETSFIDTSSGLDRYWKLHVIGRDGLAYTIAGSSAKAMSKKLDEELAEVAESLELPGSTTAWGLSSRPIFHSLDTSSGHRVKVAAPLSILVPAPENADEGDISLSDHAGTFLVLAWEHYTSDLEAMEEWSVDSMAWDRADLISRVPYEAAGREGRRSWYDADGYTVELVFLPLDDDTGLELRLVSIGDRARNESLRDKIVGSMRIEELPRVDAFPTYEPVEPEDELEPSRAAFLAAGTQIATVRPNPMLVQRTSKGLAMATSGYVSFLPDGAEDGHLLADVSWGSCSSLAWHQGQLWTDVDGLRTALPLEGMLITEAPAGGVEGAPFAALPDKSWLRAPVTTSSTVGFGPTWSGQRPTGLMLDPRFGREQELSLDGWQVSGILSTEVGVLLKVARGYESQSLATFDAAAAELRVLGRWDQLDCLAPAAGGWLVSGKPLGHGHGIYLVAPGGERELLVSGARLQGIELDASGRLLVISSDDAVWGQDPEAPLLAFAMDDIRELGPACEPLNPSAWAEAAELAVAAWSASGEPNLAHEADVRALARTFREVAHDQDLPLPTTTAGLDSAIQLVGSDQAIGGECFLALGALLSEHLLDHGAEWVEGDKVHFGMPGIFDEGIPFHTLATARLPFENVEGIRMVEGGLWDPATTILGEALGRRILIGADQEALRAALEAARGPHLDPGRMALAELQQLFTEHPENEQLRSESYMAMAKRGRYDDLMVLASPFAWVDGAKALDLRCLLAAQVNLGQAPIDELREAYRKHGGVELLLLLGRAYVAAGDKQEEASACFREVASEGWGDLASEAQERLDELDD